RAGARVWYQAPASPALTAGRGRPPRPAPPAPSSAPRCNGMCAACAMSRPAASNSPTEQSRRSLMLVENEARIRLVPISSVIDRRRFENTSIRIGSARRCAVMCFIPLPHCGRGLIRRALAMTTAPLRRARRAEFAAVEFVMRVAELAGHADRRVLAHILHVLGREGAQDALDALARAAAFRFQRMRAEHPYPLVMEQPEQKAPRRQFGVDQL